MFTRNNEVNLFVNSRVLVLIFYVGLDSSLSHCRKIQHYYKSFFLYSDYLGYSVWLYSFDEKFDFVAIIGIIIIVISGTITIYNRNK